MICIQKFFRLLFFGQADCRIFSENLFFHFVLKQLIYYDYKMKTETKEIEQKSAVSSNLKERSCF